jgi:hypothetical protein
MAVIEEKTYDVTYKCSNPPCGHKQTISFFTGEPSLPVTCCVKCRAGFGIELARMHAEGNGMFPVSA